MEEVVVLVIRGEGTFRNEMGGEREERVLEISGVW